MTNHSNGMDGFIQHDGAYGNIQNHPGSAQSASGPSRPTIQTSGPYMSPVSNQHSYQNQHHNTTPQSTTFVSQQNFPPFNLPPSDFSSSTGNLNRDSGQQYGPSTPVEYPDQTPHQSGEMMLLDQMSMPGTIPVFGSDGVLSKSPHIAIPEDFVAYLFNTQQGDASPIPGQMLPPGYASKYVLDSPWSVGQRCPLCALRIYRGGFPCSFFPFFSGLSVVEAMTDCVKL